jgi:hypothetical protein
MYSVLIGASALAVAASLSALADGEARAASALEDVQIGERGRRVRIALICDARCAVEAAAGGGFRLRGVDTTLDVDLSARSRLLSWLRVTPADGGSIVSIGAAAPVVASRIIECASDTGKAPCIDLEFAPREAAKPKQAEPPFIGAALLVARPALREDTGRDLIAFPKFAQPERLAPPAGELGLAPDADGDAVIAKPEFIAAKSREAFRPSFNLKSEAARLLGRAIDVGACEGAAARLSADAWALSAMIDVALCKADAGNAQEAENDLARLLDYTPDNYEALVARALVAQSQGRAEDARALFQQALDAAPPVTESEMIAEAIDSL